MCQEKVYDFLKENPKNYYTAKEIKDCINDKNVTNTQRACKKLFNMGYVYRRNMKYKTTKNQVRLCFVYKYKKQ